MSCPQSRAIYITHFLNPYCFHFKFQNELFSEELHQLETTIAEQANRLRRAHAPGRSRQFKPRVGFTVAAYLLESGKWVRARILDKQPADGDSIYDLWAIDHGILFRVSGHLMCPLEQELYTRKVKGSVAQGSIFGLVPAREQLNPLTFTVDYVRTECWSAEATNTLKDLHKSMINVHFQVHDVIDGYYFGDISYQTVDKRTIQLSSILERKLHLAVPVDSGSFQKEMINIITSFADSSTKVDLHKLLGAKQPRSQNREPSATCRIPMWSEHLNAPSNASGSERRRGLHTSEPKLLQNDEPVPIKSADGGPFDGPTIVVHSTCQSEIDGGRTLMWDTKLAKFDP